MDAWNLDGCKVSTKSRHHQKVTYFQIWPPADTGTSESWLALSGGGLLTDKPTRQVPNAVESMDGHRLPTELSRVQSGIDFLPIEYLAGGQNSIMMFLIYLWSCLTWLLARKDLILFPRCRAVFPVIRNHDSFLHHGQFLPQLVSFLGFP